MKAIRAAFPSAENKIRGAGIDLIPVEEGLKNPECPCLVVTMNLGEPKDDALFSVKMHLEQEVQLVRDPKVKFRVKTWEGGLFECKYMFTQDRIELLLGHCIDSFLLNYRYGNQSQSSLTYCALVEQLRPNNGFIIGAVL
jgi:hypothetical protein